MHPSFKRGHEIGYNLKKEYSMMDYTWLVAAINGNLMKEDNHVLLTLGIYVGYTSAGGIVLFGKMES